MADRQVNVNPMRIPGNWRQGYAMDYHTIQSEFLGHDEYGHPRFKTTRSEMGELVYQLKYNTDQSTIGPIVEAVALFLKGRKHALDVIVPVPPSRSRSFQPVLEIAKHLSVSLSVPLCEDCLTKTKETPELKNVYDYEARLNLLENAYVADVTKLEGKNVLLFDDLYRSGATLNALTETAYSNGEAANVYVLALTRTRSNV
jgi:competence protein ComFC